LLNRCPGVSFYGWSIELINNNSSFNLFQNNHITQEQLKKRQRFRREDVRGPYFRDQTAIIHSLAFRRLKHKTQVFFSPGNDHLCTRIEHSLHVATIAATICKALGLDIELAQAIGLGHDLGHSPFGHAGEKTLRELANYKFYHELHSLRVTDKLESKGNGLNLTYAVRDGIVSHCGESDDQFLEVAKNPNILERISNLPLRPSTWEGCVVKISDSIAYLGRDLEDAITAKLIEKNDIPPKIKKHLGTTNSEIINTLVYDVIDWSQKNGKIGISEEKFECIKALKNFSRQHIYNNPKMKYWNDYSHFVLQRIYQYLARSFERYQLDFAAYARSITSLNHKFGKYIKALQNIYAKENWDINTILCDYIAGMTDGYAIKSFQNILSSGTSGL